MKQDPNVRLIHHQFPLRPDEIIVISLPIDLTAKDAERISRFVRGLAMPDAEEPADISGISMETVGDR